MKPGNESPQSGPAYAFFRAARVENLHSYADSGKVLREYWKMNTQEERAMFARTFLWLIARRIEKALPAVYALLKIVHDRRLYAVPIDGEDAYEDFASYRAWLLGEVTRVCAAEEQRFGVLGGASVDAPSGQS